jgi:hypothetical protein
MAPGESRRRALVALRDRELAEAAAGLARARDELARAEAALARCAETGRAGDSCPLPAVLLEVDDRASNRRRDERARLAGRRDEALARVERERDAVARALRARSALERP